MTRPDIDAMTSEELWDTSSSRTNSEEPISGLFSHGSRAPTIPGACLPSTTPPPLHNDSSHPTSLGLATSSMTSSSRREFRRHDPHLLPDHLWRDPSTSSGTFIWRSSTRSFRRATGQTTSASSSASHGALPATSRSSNSSSFRCLALTCIDTYIEGSCC